MKLISYDPFAEMEEMFSMQKAFIPAMDVYEEGNNLVVETPLAGVDAADVDVSVSKGVLTVAGKNKKEHEVDDKNYYRKEVRSGSFYRQVALPVPVKEDKVQAELVGGVLKITCPKAEGVVAKKISVKVVKEDK